MKWLTGPLLGALAPAHATATGQLSRLAVASVTSAAIAVVVALPEIARQACEQLPPVGPLQAAEQRILRDGLLAALQVDQPIDVGGLLIAPTEADK